MMDCQVIGGEEVEQAQEKLVKEPPLEVEMVVVAHNLLVVLEEHSIPHQMPTLNLEMIIREEAAIKVDMNSLVVAEEEDIMAVVLVDLV